MSAEPRCNAELYIGDDHGDDMVTIRCQLHPGHLGQHQEKFRRDSSGEVAINWWKDERQSREPDDE